jgi:transposase InsO family protein
MFRWLRHNGYTWNHKRVYKIYRELALNLRIKPKKRLATRTPIPLHQPAKPNAFWSMDFMSDSLACGKKFRTLNVLDQYWFHALDEVRDITDEWMGMYNGQRPHSSLGNKTPWEFMACSLG